MDWLKKHGDTIATLAVFAGCFWHLNEKMNDRLSAIEKDVAIIKTVLIMKNIMPNELAVKEETK
ncbi:MAG TPA: hypothetical protein VGK47_11415 [Nitrososphaeraceae archaeon]